MYMSVLLFCRFLSQNIQNLFNQSNIKFKLIMIGNFIKHNIKLSTIKIFVTKYELIVQVAAASSKII